MRLRQILTILLAVGVCALASRPAWAYTAPSVVVYPAGGAYSTGQFIHVQVWVENVTDLYGADVQLAFDPAAFQVQDANPSAPGVQIKLRSDFLQPGFVLHREANNTTGSVWYANSQVNPALPVSGSGALFEFDLLTLKAGSFTLDIASHLLAASGGVAIPSNPYGATYTVINASYLPLLLRGN